MNSGPSWGRPGIIQAVLIKKWYKLLISNTHEARPENDKSVTDFLIHAIIGSLCEIVFPVRPKYLRGFPAETWSTVYRRHAL